MKLEKKQIEFLKKIIKTVFTEKTFLQREIKMKLIFFMKNIKNSII